MTVLVTGLAAVVGLVAALVSGGTWQRVLVTTFIYGAAAMLMLAVVALPSQRRRVARQNGSASRYEGVPKKHP